MTGITSQHLKNRQVRKLTELAAQYLGIPAEVIMGKERTTNKLINARWCVMWVAHYGLELGWSQIKHATGRDHSTVINACRRFGVLMADEPFWMELAHRLLRHVEAGDLDVRVDPIPQPQLPVVVNPNKPGPAVSQEDTPFYEKDGHRGSSREYLQRQNDNFVAAMKRALQNSE